MPVVRGVRQAEDFHCLELVFAKMTKQLANRIGGACPIDMDLWNITEPCRPMTVRRLNDDFAEGLHEESILVRVCSRLNILTSHHHKNGRRSLSLPTLH